MRKPPLALIGVAVLVFLVAGFLSRMLGAPRWLGLVVMIILLAAVIVLVFWRMSSGIACPGCGTGQPPFRRPTNSRQLMWGGWTCRTCGAELDRKGQVVP